MSEIVGEAVLRIRTDDEGVDRDVSRAGKKAGEGYSKGFKASLKGLAGTAGAALAGIGVGNFLKDGIANATSLQDEIGALGVIIGEQGTKKIEEFSNTSAQAFGIAKVDALEAAHTFATFGKSAGLSGKDLAKFSTDFTGLAGDLASFNGGSTEDAITAIGGALRGETEGIRRYGVLLDENVLKQEAMRLGLIKTTKEALTPQQKVLAAQAAIYKQTKDAQGDSARTADSAANAQKRLTAQLKDLQTQAGTKLLPVVTKVVAGLSSFVTGMNDGTGAGGKFADVLSNVGDRVEGFVADFKAGEGVAGTLRDGLEGLVEISGAVIQFFDGLPGSIKKFIVVGGLAYYAMTRLGAGALFAQGRIATMSATMGTAAGRASLMTGAMQKVGGVARNAAGAGGMLLLADATNETSEGMGALKGAAGGVLTGASLGAFGGPVGAAIGAGIGGIAGLTLGLATATKDAGESAKIALPDWRDYRETLDGVSAATTQATRAMVFQRLEQSGLLATTNQLGLSEREAVNAVLGVGNGRKKLSLALRENATLTDEQKEAWKRETGAIEKSRESQLRRNLATAEGKEEIKKARTALRLFMKEPANKKVTVDTYQASQRIKDLRKGLKEALGLIKGVNTSANVLDPSGLLNPGQNQSGTMSWRGGATWVGETGPEIIVPPRGSRIYSNAESQQMTAGSMIDTEALARVVIGAVSVAQRPQITQNYLGPTNGRERLDELAWTLKYATRAPGQTVGVGP